MHAKKHAYAQAHTHTCTQLPIQWMTACFNPGALLASRQKTEGEGGVKQEKVGGKPIQVE